MVGSSSQQLGSGAPATNRHTQQDLCVQCTAAVVTCRRLPVQTTSRQPQQRWPPACLTRLCRCSTLPRVSAPGSPPSSSSSLPLSLPAIAEERETSAGFGCLACVHS